MTSRHSINDLNPDELTAWFAEHGCPSYRQQQLNQWLFGNWCLSFDDMRTLPKELRSKLNRHFRACSVECREQVRSEDGTRKFLLQLPDQEAIETVLIPASRRNTVCISTQVGCPVRCAFCASGRDGLIRDLSSAEIIDQVLFACHVLGERVTNIVVMGMGEPLLNMDNLIRALEVLCDKDRLGIGARHITISTSGIVPGIRRLASLHRQWNLALSLHAATDAGRQRYIPDKHRYPIADILAACVEYRRTTGRMVTLEYTLIAGENDSFEDAVGLARIARNLDAKINLIPCNPTSERYRKPPRQAIRDFLDKLGDSNARVTVRQSRGQDIGASCGQLRQRRTDCGTSRCRRRAPDHSTTDGGVNAS